MKITIKLGVFYVLSITLLVKVIINIVDSTKKSIKEHTEMYKKHMGSKYIIGKDTLIVVDYSIINENFTLSDGRKVNFNLINK